ncbi:MAG TPA: pantoate--beta-alanine ligase [Methylotenera sp.]|nr:pantoate--beta-alanine ligase [Methylotenera sp.]
MEIISSISELRSTLKNQGSALKNQPRIAFVPTMGNLHDGHIKLVEIAKQHAQSVVVSIFVNPLQFGPNEDLANYPRTLEADCWKLQAAGANIVFTPSVEEMYPDAYQTEQAHLNLGQSMTITPPPIANELCGASRPGHFDGVATVVAKLFNIVQPDVAVFGKKDFQQLFIIRELVKQFNLAIEIIAGDTVREPSGLAMSSRNGYLTEEQKTQAAQLHKMLEGIVLRIRNGSAELSVLADAASLALKQLGWEVDYVSIRSQTTLMPASSQDQQLVVLAAAKLGTTRLIDNIDFLR